MTPLVASASILARLVDRFDPELFWPMRPDARLRLAGGAEGEHDVVFAGDRAFLVAPAGRADAILTADPRTWEMVVDDVRGGLDAFGTGRLRVRRDLHLGIGFLAATADAGDRAGLRFAQVSTAVGELSINEAGSGPAVVLVHGLGATKVSMLPTVAALAASGFRAIALDLPGFGDSVKPIRAPYNAPYFARAIVALMDALGVARADVVGNSLGGRIAIEMGLRFPNRVGRLGLLAPSLAWLGGRPLAPLLRLLQPQVGLLQPAPRAIVEAIVRVAVPESSAEPWTAAGVDEFLRSYFTPRGRVAFYAAARNIYLEEPLGPRGLWTRLAGLQVPSLFVWGRTDRLVPIAFAGHVREVLPSAAQLELDCGHVPQLEAPEQTHEALAAFLTGRASGLGSAAAALNELLQCRAAAGGHRLTMGEEQRVEGEGGEDRAECGLEALLDPLGIVAEQRIGKEVKTGIGVGDGIGEEQRARPGVDVQRALVGGEHADRDRGDAGSDLAGTVLPGGDVSGLGGAAVIARRA